MKLKWPTKHALDYLELLVVLENCHAGSEEGNGKKSTMGRCGGVEKIDGDGLAEIRAGGLVSLNA